MYNNLLIKIFVKSKLINGQLSIYATHLSYKLSTYFKTFNKFKDGHIIQYLC